VLYATCYSCLITYCYNSQSFHSVAFWVQKCYSERTNLLFFYQLMDYILYKNWGYSFNFPGLDTSANQNSERYKLKYQRKKGSASLGMLPDDLLIDIMSWLPPKTFCRCKMSPNPYSPCQKRPSISTSDSIQLYAAFHSILSWYGAY
jgi:hypothetical protein